MPIERENGKRKLDPDAVAKQLAFMGAHRFIWEWLLSNAQITLAVDRENPTVIWAWLVATDNVIHAVGCKRSFITEKLSVELVGDLLGDRLREHQVCSLELPQMGTRSVRARNLDAIGIDRPSSWSMDPTWLLTRIPR